MTTDEVNTHCTLTWAAQDLDGSTRASIQSTIAAALDDATVTFDWRKQAALQNDYGQQFDRGLIGSESDV